MDKNSVNPYTTEIPVSEAEKELHHTTTPPVAPLPYAQRPTLPPSTPIGTLPPSPLSRSRGKLPMIIVSILLLAVGFLIGYILRGMLIPVTPAPVTKKVVPSPIPTAIPTPTITPQASSSANPNSNQFSSAELAISFDTAKTLTDNADKTVLTQTVGSRVYVYLSGTQPTAGQYVDVLSKISTDTTIGAAQKITANDPQFSSCVFEISSQTIFPSTYERVVPNCPSKPGSGVRYFLTDSAHPNKLLFISIGQYGIPASNTPQPLWQDTLKFL